MNISTQSTCNAVSLTNQKPKEVAFFLVFRPFISSLVFIFLNLCRFLESFCSFSMPLINALQILCFKMPGNNYIVSTVH